MTAALSSSHSPCGPAAAASRRRRSTGPVPQREPVRSAAHGSRRDDPGRRLGQPLSGVPAGTVPSAHREAPRFRGGADHRRRRRHRRRHAGAAGADPSRRPDRHGGTHIRRLSDLRADGSAADRHSAVGRTGTPRPRRHGRRRHRRRSRGGVPATQPHRHGGAGRGPPALPAAHWFGHHGAARRGVHRVRVATTPHPPRVPVATVPERRCRAHLLKSVRVGGHTDRVRHLLAGHGSGTVVDAVAVRGHRRQPGRGRGVVRGRSSAASPDRTDHRRTRPSALAAPGDGCLER